jgi:hypothetical protein
MSTKTVLDWKVRRSVSESPKTTKEALSQAAQTLLEADRPASAVDLAQKAGDEDILAKVKALAVEEGNLFLYVRVCQASGKPASAAELAVLADQAKAAGLASYEARARELLSGGPKPS